MSIFGKDEKDDLIKESEKAELDAMLKDIENDSGSADLLDDFDIDFDNENEFNSDSNETSYSEQNKEVYETYESEETTYESEETTEYDEDEQDDTDEDETIEITDTEETEEETDENEVKDLVLYIIADKCNPGMLEYFRSYGANVSKIFTNIEEARDTLLIQVVQSRLVVLDTGTGRFTNMGTRKALIDLLGICDEDTRISVFYTDSVIKEEVSNAEEVEDKLITWHTYRSTADVLANILQNSKKENYIFDNEAASVDNTVDENCLNIKGLPVACEESMDLGLPSIRPDEIRINMVENDSTDGEIEGYKIKI